MAHVNSRELNYVKENRNELISLLKVHPFIKSLGLGKRSLNKYSYAEVLKMFNMVFPSRRICR